MLTALIILSAIGMWAETWAKRLIDYIDTSVQLVFILLISKGGKAKLISADFNSELNEKPQSISSELRKHAVK